MLQKKHIIQFLNEQLDTVDTKLNGFCRTGDKEALHDMRVAIKKIKAIVWMADKHSQEKVLKKCLLPIDQIFKQAGNIRNAQLNVKYCQEHPIVYNKLTLQQQRIIQANFTSFCSNQKLYAEQIKQAAACMKTHWKSIPNKMASLIIEKRTKRIIKGLGSAAPFLPEQLHEYRKKIKSIIHLHQLCIKYTNQKILKHSHTWNKLQDDIGTWHDLVLFKDQLHNMHIAQKHINPIELRAQQQLLTIQELSKKLVKKYTVK